MGIQIGSTKLIVYVKWFYINYYDPYVCCKFHVSRSVWIKLTLSLYKTVLYK